MKIYIVNHTHHYDGWSLIEPFRTEEEAITQAKSRMPYKKDKWGMLDPEQFGKYSKVIHVWISDKIHERIEILKFEL